MEAGAARCRTRGSPSHVRQIQEPPYTISCLKFEGRVRHRPTWAQKILSPGTNLGHVDRPLSSSGLLRLSQRHDLLLMVCRA